MELVFASANAATSWLPLTVLFVVVAGALVFIGLRAKTQRQQQFAREQVVLDSLADFRDVTDLKAEEWVEPLVSMLASLQERSDDWRSDDWPSDGLPSAGWIGIVRGQYSGRAILSFTTVHRSLLLIELSSKAEGAYPLTIQPAPVPQDSDLPSHGNGIGTSDTITAAPDHRVEFGDNALNRDWAVHCLDAAYAETVVDIAMRGRLFGIDARGLRLTTTGRALGASFPLPASREYLRDRLVLLTEFADRIEMHAEHIEPRVDDDS